MSRWNCVMSQSWEKLPGAPPISLLLPRARGQISYVSYTGSHQPEEAMWSWRVRESLGPISAWWKNLLDSPNPNCHYKNNHPELGTVCKKKKKSKVFQHALTMSKKPMKGPQLFAHYNLTYRWPSFCQGRH